MKNHIKKVDVLIVGAGFAGMYLIHKLRKKNLSLQCIEAGSEVGGTWYWNRYPGARCDVESVEYSFSFNDEIQQKWEWLERYATQPEINAYQKYVADELDLRKDILFNTKVTDATYDEDAKMWTITTDKNEYYLTKFFIAATGCLSVPLELKIKGLNNFEGDVIYTARWPKDKTVQHFLEKKVGVIGTGSTGIQTIPEVAKVAKDLLVFHRVANYSVPARNQPLTEEFKKNIKENYTELREKAKKTFGGTSLGAFNDVPASNYTTEEQQIILEELWHKGGTAFMGAFGDMMVNAESNKIAATFIDNKIKQIVKDPIKADILTPKDLFIGSRRICVDSDYFATYNRDNVHLVDVKNNNIAEITPDGIKLEDGTEYKLDALILATGYDAMTGALNRINITGKGGQKLIDKWTAGPTTYLGLSVSNFPNFFMITGPGSPSVFANMVSAIEQHVDWIAIALDYFYNKNYTEIDAIQEFENDWVAHVNEIANYTLLPTAASWYLGANVEGKPRVFMPYVGGLRPYGEKINDVAINNYRGYQFQ